MTPSFVRDAILPLPPLCPHANWPLSRRIDHRFQMQRTITTGSTRFQTTRKHGSLPCNGAATSRLHTTDGGGGLGRMMVRVCLAVRAVKTELHRGGLRM
jgi:hypothetical protein